MQAVVSTSNVSVAGTVYSVVYDARLVEDPNDVHFAGNFTAGPCTNICKYNMLYRTFDPVVNTSAIVRSMQIVSEDGNPTVYYSGSWSDGTIAGRSILDEQEFTSVLNNTYINETEDMTSSTIFACNEFSLYCAMQSFALVLENGKMIFYDGDSMLKEKTIS